MQTYNTDWLQLHVDQSIGIMWALPAYQSTSVGETRYPTRDRLSQHGQYYRPECGGSTYAAGLARAYNGGSYTDWFLPSKDELNKLYINKVAIGGFFADFYWSSSELNAYVAWGQAFINGYQYGNYEYSAYRVRAVRAF